MSGAGEWHIRRCLYASGPALLVSMLAAMLSGCVFVPVAKEICQTKLGLQNALRAFGLSPVAILVDVAVDSMKPYVDVGCSSSAATEHVDKHIAQAVDQPLIINVMEVLRATEPTQHARETQCAPDGVKTIGAHADDPCWIFHTSGMWVMSFF